MILAFGKGDWVQLSYMVAALLFVFGIKQLSRVKTARKGNQMAASAMLLATVATMVLLWGQVALWIIVAGVLVGGVAGYLLATKTPMTAMPEQMPEKMLPQVLAPRLAAPMAAMPNQI